MLAVPVTIEDHLSAAYAARFRLAGWGSEDMADVITRFRGAGFTRPALEAARDRLLPVEGRCAVSRAHRSILDEVLGGME